MSDSGGRRGIARQLLTFLVVAAVVASAVGPALAATPTSTWDGEVSLSGTPTDGTSYQYDVTNLDSVSNFTVNLTGVTTTEAEVSATAKTSVGSGATVDVAGNAEPLNDSLTIRELRDVGTLENTYSSGTKTASHDIGDSQVDTVNMTVENLESSYGSPIEARVIVGGTEYWQNVTLDPGETRTLTFSIGASTNGEPIKLNRNVGQTTGDDLVSSAITADEIPVSGSVDVVVNGVTHSVSHSDGSASTVDADFVAGANSVEFQTSVAAVKWDAAWTERTKTGDAGIGLNTQDGGGWMNYSSTLADGETVSLVTNESWVQSGTNVVDVQLGDGSLSADAPTPKVKLAYSHRAASTQSVTVDGEVWSERWNTSRTWASDRDDATLSIPFAESVVATRAVTVYSNGSEVGATSTNFNGTTLNVGLGDVEAGETTTVVANGSKVRTVNGSIAVTEPTPVGQQLDTKFRVEARSPGFHIDVGSTTKDEWLHYTGSESWSDPAEFARFDSSGGQSLYFPNAPAGGTARVSTLAVDVDTSQNVDVGVAQPGSLVFDVAPGPTTGDDVTFNYVGATSGTEYELVSVDRDDYRLSRDSGSTAILTADDSAETLQIRPINSSTGTTQLQDVSSGGGGIPAAVDPRANPYALLALSGIVIMGGVGIAAYKPHDAIPMWVVIPLLVPVTLIVIATQSPGTLRQLVAGQFGAALQQVGPALLLLGGTVVSYVIYKLAQSLGPDRTTISFRGLRGKK